MSGNKKKSISLGKSTESDPFTIELLQTQVKDLNERLTRSKEKCEQLMQENDLLVKTQNEFAQDKKDIVEFLHLKLQEQGTQLISMENKVKDLVQEKKDMLDKAQQELEDANNKAKLEIDQLQTTVMRYRTEIMELDEFKSKKEEFLEQIRNLKQTLEAKELEYQENIHNIEKKVLQDKSQLKKEMLQKVHEAVTNFRKVADQQMAETTKRAIKENTAITTQLQKMSTKTMDLITENEQLSNKLSNLKSENSLLKETEKQLAKRNISHQKVIQMLIDKLRETDKMLEVAYDTGIIKDVNEILEAGKKIDKNLEQEMMKYRTEAEQERIKSQKFQKIIDEVCLYVTEYHENFLGTVVEDEWMGLINMLVGYGDELSGGHSLHNMASVTSKELWAKTRDEDEEQDQVEEDLKPRKNEKAAKKVEKPPPQHPKSEKRELLLLNNDRWGPPAQTLPSKGPNMFVPHTPTIQKNNTEADIN